MKMRTTSEFVRSREKLLGLAMQLKPLGGVIVVAVRIRGAVVPNNLSYNG